MENNNSNNDYLNHKKGKKQKEYIARMPPHSIEAEQALLGGIMINLKSCEEINNYVNEDDFYRKEHKKIYKIISNLILNDKSIDIVTVRNRLESENTVKDIGGVQYLVELSKNVPPAANIITYAEIIKEKSLLRKLIKIGEKIIENSLNNKGKTGNIILDEIEYLIFNLNKREKKNGNPQTINEILTNTVSKIETMYLNSSHIVGIPTGFHDLDHMISGLQKSNLIIIAGRPSMGKTTLAMNIVENIILQQKKTVLFFSMEMPSESLTMRILSSISKINQNDIRTGQIKKNDWPKLSSAIETLSDKKLLIDDTGEINILEIRSKAKKILREYGDLELIVIDYLQLMHMSNASDNRTTEVSLISRSLKILSRELDIPIIVLSQLNRNLEQRNNKRPFISDLRESGSIEQDADLILFIYRDEVYNKDTNDKGISEIIIGKQRNGEIGTIKLTFLGQFARFENYIKRENI